MGQVTTGHAGLAIATTVAALALLPLGAPGALQALTSPNGLWLALMTTPRSARWARVRYATPGVGKGPSSTTSTPAELKPDSSALSSM